MPLYAGKYAICPFLQNMRNMLRSHDRYKPVSLFKDLKYLVCGVRYPNNHKMKSVVNAWPEGQT